MFWFTINRSNKLVEGKISTNDEKDEVKNTYGYIIRIQTWHSEMIKSIDELFHNFIFQSTHNRLDKITLDGFKFRIDYNHKYPMTFRRFGNTV